MPRKALGRGLSALIREVETMPPVGVTPASSEPAADRAEAGGAAGPSTMASVTLSTQSATPSATAPTASSSIAGGLQQVPLDLIDPNPFQPRQTLPAESLKELADSIHATGLLQPVLLRPAGARFQIVAGERRFHAATLAGLGAIPALVRKLSDQESLELALTENLLREDLNPLEIAQAYNVLQSDFGLTHEQIAARLGLNRATVANTIRLLRLPEPVQRMLARGELTHGHARALLGLSSPSQQQALAKVIRSKNLSVRAVEDMVNQHLRKIQRVEDGTQTAPRPVDANVLAASHALERALGTRVRITGNGKRGRIQISYFSGEDLNRIYELIAGKSP